MGIIGYGAQTGRRRVMTPNGASLGSKTLLCVPIRAHCTGDCQDFRVWPGIMGNKESHYVTTQRTCHTE